MVTFTGKALPMTGPGMAKVCAALEVGELEIWAVLMVETNGFGFLKDRRPQILFERHIFSKLTRGEFDRDHPDISNKTPGGYMGGAAEYSRLETAMALSPQRPEIAEAALKSASWGLPQIMGFNHEQAGFNSVSSMIQEMVDSEDAQLAALGNFIKSSDKCRIGLQRRDWGTFAACYNGANFSINQYDKKLAAAFEKSKLLLPDIGYRAAQAALTFLDLDPGPVDGIRGRQTHGCLVRYQEENGLVPTGDLNDATNASLMAKAFG
jgi:hypothetical protein